MKTLVHLLGSTAAGKSTLSRALCGTGTQEFVAAVGGRRTKFVLGRDGIALAGNLKNGSDCISRIETLRQTVELLLESREVVIVDGVRSSYKFVSWSQHIQLPQLAAIFVYLDVSLATNVARLMGRRRANGVVEDRLPERTHHNLLRTRRRAWRVFDYARLCYKRYPRAFLVVPEGTTPEQSAARIWDEIAKMQAGGNEGNAVSDAA